MYIKTEERHRKPQGAELNYIQTETIFEKKSVEVVGSRRSLDLITAV